jgi:hypothetical protein
VDEQYNHCKQSARGQCCFGDRRRFTTQTSGKTGRTTGCAMRGTGVGHQNRVKTARGSEYISDSATIQTSTTVYVNSIALGVDNSSIYCLNHLPWPRARSLTNWVTFRRGPSRAPVPQVPRPCHLPARYTAPNYLLWPRERSLTNWVTFRQGPLRVPVPQVAASPLEQQGSKSPEAKKVGSSARFFLIIGLWEVS